MPEPNQPGTPGNAQPGAPGTPGTEDAPKYVTAEDFGKTAALISGMQKTLKDLQSGILTADKLAEFGLLEKDETAGTYKPKASQPQSAPKPKNDDDPVVARVKALEKQLADAKREKEDADRRMLETERDRAIIAALTKAGAVNPERDYVHLTSKVARGESGYSAKGRDQYGSETDLALDDFAEQWLKSNPELRRTAAQSGSGTPHNAPGKSGKTASGATVIPRSQWSDMSFFMANKTKFDSGEWVRGNA